MTSDENAPDAMATPARKWRTSAGLPRIAAVRFSRQRCQAMNVHVSVAARKRACTPCIANVPWHGRHVDVSYTVGADHLEARIEVRGSGVVRRARLRNLETRGVLLW